jgi:hypothetical protein
MLSVFGMLFRICVVFPYSHCSFNFSLYNHLIVVSYLSSLAGVRDRDGQFRGLNSNRRVDVSN